MRVPNNLTITVLFIFIIQLPLFGQDTTRPNNFGELLKSDKFLLGKNIFSGFAGFGYMKIDFFDKEGEQNVYHRPTFRWDFNINPWKHIWIRNAFIFDLAESKNQPPWVSNYFYQIGHYDWGHKKFSFGYENYAPNRWDTFFDEFYSNFKQGFLFASYNLVYRPREKVRFKYRYRKYSEKRVVDKLALDETSQITIVPQFRIYPEYRNELNEVGGTFKTVGLTNIRYIIWKNIYIEGAFFFYPTKDDKLAWDPDFTYGFGMFNWRGFRLNFSYGNWIANRYPWSDGGLKNHDFSNGNFLVFINYNW